MNKNNRNNQILALNYSGGQNSKQEKPTQNASQNDQKINYVNDKCAPALQKKQSNQQALKISFNRIIKQVSELKQSASADRQERFRLKNNIALLNQSITFLSQKMYPLEESTNQQQVKQQELNSSPLAEDESVFNVKKQFELSKKIIRGIDQQFQKFDYINTQRQTILKNHQQTIRKLQKQVFQLQIEKIAFQKQKEVYIGKHQHLYDQLLSKQRLITELKISTEVIDQKLKAQKELQNEKISAFQFNQSQDLSQLVQQKNTQIFLLQQSYETLKMHQLETINQLNAKETVENILNQKLKFETTKNQQLQQEIRRYNEELLELQQKCIQLRNQNEHLSTKQFLTEGNNPLFKQKCILQHSLKLIQQQNDYLLESLAELKEKFQRKQNQLKKLRKSNEKEIQDLRMEFQEYRKMSSQHQEHLKQLSKEGNNTNQIILDGLQKQNLQLQSQIQKERSVTAQKQIMIQKLMHEVEQMQSCMKQKQKKLGQMSICLSQVEDQLKIQWLNFDKKLEEKQSSVNELIQSKDKDIANLQEQLLRIREVSNQESIQKVDLLQKYCAQMKESYEEMTIRYQNQINQKQKHIIEYESRIEKLILENQKLKLKILKENQVHLHQQYSEIQAAKNNIESSQLQNQEICNQSNISKQFVQTLQTKLNNAQKIISSLDIDNIALISKVQILSKQLENIHVQQGCSAQMKKVQNAELSKIVQIQQMKIRWQNNKKHYFNNIQQQFRQYKLDTERMNDKLMKNYDLLKTEQEKYRQLVDRYEQALEWNQRLLQENNALRQQKNQPLKNIEVSQQILFQQNQQQGSNIGEEMEISSVNHTKNIQNQNHDQQLKFKQGIIKQYQNLQHMYAQLEQQYIKSSQEWLDQKEFLSVTINNLKSELQNTANFTVEHRKPVQKPLRKPRNSMYQYQQQMNLKLQLQRVGSQLHEWINGISQIAYLLNLKGMNQGNPRYRIQTIKLAIQSLLHQVSGFKKEIIQRNRQIENRNLRYETKDRQSNRIKSKAFETQGTDRDFFQGTQTNMLHELHKRMKGQQNRNIMNRI